MPSPPSWSLYQRNHRTHFHWQRGQSLVKFALVAPILLVEIFGIIEYRFFSQSLNTVNFVALEGQRIRAVIGPADAVADSKIIQAIQDATFKWTRHYLQPDPKN